MGAFDQIPLLEQPTFQSTYAGAPVQEFQQTGQALEDRYYRNAAAMDELSILAAQDQVLGGDQGDKDRVIGDIRSVFKDIAEKGDAYETSTSQIRELARRYYTDPRRMAAKQNYSTAQAHLASERKRYETGEIDKLQWENTRRQIQNYGGLGDSEDPTEWGAPSLFSGAKKVDIPERLGKALDALEADMGTSIRYDEPSGMWVTSKGKGISEDRIMDAAADYLASDTEAQSYLSDLYQLQGEDYTNAQLDTMMAAQAKIRRFSQTDVSIEADAYNKLAYGKKLDQKKDPTIPIMTQVAGYPFASSRTANAGMKAGAMELDGLNKRLEVLASQGLTGSPEYEKALDQQERLTRQLNRYQETDDRLTEEAIAATGVTQEELEQQGQWWRDVVPEGYIAKNDAWGQVNDYKDDKYEELAKASEVDMTTYLFADDDDEEWMQNFVNNVTGFQHVEPGEKIQKRKGLSIDLESIKSQVTQAKWIGTNPDFKGEITDDQWDDVAGLDVIGYANDPDSNQDVAVIVPYNSSGNPIGSTIGLGLPNEYFQQAALEGRTDGPKTQISNGINRATGNPGTETTVPFVANGKTFNAKVTFDPRGKDAADGDYKILIPRDGNDPIVARANSHHDAVEILQGGFRRFVNK